MGNEDAIIPEFAIDDGVKVKPGTLDSDRGEFGIDGWQGRVEDIIPNDFDEIPIIGVAWDAITLQHMPPEFISDRIAHQADYTMMYLDARSLAPARLRGSEADTEREIESIERRFFFHYFGERGERLRRILEGVATDDVDSALKRWQVHLQRVLACPFNATAKGSLPLTELYRGNRVRVLSVDQLHDDFGVLMTVDFENRRLSWPLGDLAAEKEDSPTSQLVEDYGAWFDTLF